MSKAIEVVSVEDAVLLGWAVSCELATDACDIRSPAYKARKRGISLVSKVHLPNDPDTWEVARKRLCKAIAAAEEALGYSD